MIQITTEQSYLNKLCNSINNRSQNYLWVQALDSYIDDYLESEQATWIRKNKNEGIVYIPRYNREYIIMKASENHRAYRARNALIDHRISTEILKTIVVPTLVYCTECYSF